MKSNIGFVFVVNSEKAFGRFVKESAGEEEMTSCKRRTSHLEQLQTVVSTSRSSRERDESRESSTKSVGEANS